MGDSNLHTTKGHATEAILFGLVPTGDPRTAAEALTELQQLAETAGFVPAGCIVYPAVFSDRSDGGSAVVVKVPMDDEARAAEAAFKAKARANA